MKWVLIHGSVRKRKRKKKEGQKKPSLSTRKIYIYILLLGPQPLHIFSRSLKQLLLILNHLSILRYPLPIQVTQLFLPLRLFDLRLIRIRERDILRTRHLLKIVPDMPYRLLFYIDAPYNLRLRWRRRKLV
ncbi:hypothetical protein I7I48_06179 [Histoplasma ohiense]|nr:hypothetical protein I7I48_06179 [Histoplasma ohiense (nom. inval.)]